MVELVAFEAGDVTCGHSQGTASDPIGVRLRPLSHLLHAAIRTESNLAHGELTVERVHPGESTILIRRPLPDVAGNSRESTCIALFDVDEIGQDAIAETRPHSEMEVYRVRLCWREAQLNICVPVVDCDCVLACYEYAGRTILERWRQSHAGATADLTWHAFLAKLARNGADALCAAYRESAVSPRARFHDHRWAACVSTVLAEDYHRVFAGREEITPAWGSFLRAGDRPFGWRLSPMKIHDFQASAQAFANAHTRDGVQRAINKHRCGRSANSASDLQQIADILIAAQIPMLDSLHVRAPFGRSVPGFFARRTFEKYLRDSLAAGLS